jgi:hypothetical protein
MRPIGYYMGNCLDRISQALRILPPNRHARTWQDVGDAMSLDPVELRHKRLMEILHKCESDLTPKPEKASEG